MAKITDIPETFTAVGPLATDELWQCVAGAVEISTDASPAAGDGWQLATGDGIHLSTGLTVRYRRSGLSAAVLVRGAA